MKKITTTLILVIISFINLNAQEFKFEEYKGTMNDSVSIVLYLRSTEHECSAEIMYQGMYKYDGINNWLQVNITQNDKKQFVMVDYGFSGVLLLNKTAKGFSGVWISSDAKKKLKIELQKNEITKEETEKYEDIYEEVNYSNNDC
ncbi:hypothetical protein JBL43_19550 [Aureibaculum sp. A20]|uniref:Uncharacterized protein n=1 Tax=Aureibaculum flavum TaxID=2795986 RepID=A0ABS0WX08_9FLAO|nr:hypothetical protein [Aureibaculum flavum]MBJ2176455.1 hypothetical protein [Aureibaculum flavum]